MLILIRINLKLLECLNVQPSKYAEFGGERHHQSVINMSPHTPTTKERTQTFLGTNNTQFSSIEMGQHGFRVAFILVLKSPKERTLVGLKHSGRHDAQRLLRGAAHAEA
ncbi:hypothetical protein ASE76_07785 [Xylophilus sp. Leaf220]|nr:hypothetical protein ASE76_07785 [Xylophilus sp. Leaf220]